MKRLSVLVLVLASLFFNSSSFGRVVDGERASHPVIRSIADDLESRKINARNGKRRVGSVSDRPQLTELRNFKSDLRKVKPGDPFVSTFSAGLVSERAYLVAVNSPGTPQPNALRDFTKAWESAAKESRVFISFSGKDIQQAQLVAEALRKQNYIVFLFKNSDAKLSAVNAVETGQFFREAGHHFVIDTPNARMSVAVLAEARALSDLDKGRRVPPRFHPSWSPAVSRPSIPCCHVCTYRNGIKVGCGATICGVIECTGAR